MEALYWFNPTMIGIYILNSLPVSRIKALAK